MRVCTGSGAAEVSDKGCWKMKSSHGGVPQCAGIVELRSGGTESVCGNFASADIVLQLNLLVCHRACSESLQYCIEEIPPGPRPPPPARLPAPALESKIQDKSRTMQENQRKNFAVLSKIVLSFHRTWNRTFEHVCGIQLDCRMRTSGWDRGSRHSHATRRAYYRYLLAIGRQPGGSLENLSFLS